MSSSIIFSIISSLVSIDKPHPLLKFKPPLVRLYKTGGGICNLVSVDGLYIVYYFMCLLEHFYEKVRFCYEKGVRLT